jgi:uncharacterized protein
VWFIFLIIGLSVLLVGGLYTRRRLLRSLAFLGAGPRTLRVVRWGSLWLLYAYPILVFTGIFASRILGASTFPRLDGPWATPLLLLPFFLSLLVMVQALPFLIALDVARLVARLLGRWKERAERVHAAAVVLAIVAFAIYTPGRILIERGALRVRHFALAPAAAADDQVPLAGERPPPFRIAFVADVQQDAATGPEEVGEVVELINRERVDLVLSGGDWINSGPDYIAAAAKSAGALQSRLGTYSVRGDHEHFAYVDRQRSVGEVERALAANKVTMLANEVRWFTHAGRRIGVAFLNYNYIVRSDDETIRELVTQLDGADYAILVTHQFNEHVAQLVKDRVDLVLAAHTHGGQVNPVLGFFHFPLASLETRFIDGRYALGKTTVITTAGVGFSLVPFRYASPGSLEILELQL